MVPWRIQELLGAGGDSTGRRPYRRDMVRALLLGLAAVIAVIVAFAVLGTILHFLFLIVVVVAIGFLALRAGRSRFRSRR